MNLNDAEMALYIRGVPTPSSPFLSLPHSRNSPSIDLRSQQQNCRRSSYRTGYHQVTSPTLGWRRHSEKSSRLHPAPDVAYRNTYLQQTKQDPLDLHVSHAYLRPPQDPPRIESPLQKYQSYTIYDYIRQIEHQRKLKRDLSLHIQRPQNEDRILKHVLSKRKTPCRSTSSAVHSTSTESVINDSPTIANYMKHLRLIQLTTSSQSHPQKQRI